MTGTGSAVTESSTATRVAEVGLPVVERGVLGVAVAAVVPRHDAPAGVGEQRREHVEGAGEVEAAVGEQERRRRLVAPLVHGDGQPVAVDGALPVGPPGAGIGDRLGHRAAPCHSAAVTPVNPVTDVIWTFRPDRVMS